MENDQKGAQFNRRDFIKTTALAGMAAALPVTGLAGQSTISGSSKPSPEGTKRNLLFISSAPENYERLIESIRSVKEYEILVIPMKVDFRKPEDILKSIRDKDADILLMCLPSMGFSSRHIAEGMGTLDIPVILLPISFDLILWETDLAAAFRTKGTNALLADSEGHAIELIKILAAARLLEGQKALVFGKPFKSTSVPAPNLDEDYIYKRTGVRVEHRPIEDLIQLIKGADESSARKEMERWKKEAAKIDGPTDKIILDCSRMYVLLRSIVDQEGLSGISVDCLSYTFGPDTSLQTPCLAFTRLKDEGVSATCEADICMMLSSMLLQEISQRPSFVCNVSSVNTQTSTAVLRHCVAPTKIFGADASPLPYNLLYYHGMEKGVVPEIEYPVGLDITMGGFSKDLKDFVLWPGRIQPGIYDMDTPSFINAPPGMGKMRRYCSNRADVKIKDVNRFLQSIAGIHHIMVAGSYAKEVHDAMLRMNVNVIAPPDLTAPEI